TGEACNNPAWRFVAGGVCEQGPCNGVCCDAITGACVLPPNGGATCTCGGTWQGYATSCTPTPCVVGACCTGAAVCYLATPLGCTSSSVYLGNGTVCTPTNPCTSTPTSSACCNLVTGACTVAVNKP